MSVHIQLFNPDQVLPEACADYVCRNRAFLEPYEPAHSEDYYTDRFWKDLLAAQLVEMEHGRAMYFYISEEAGADRIIGTVSLTGIIMGPFCSAFLGYRLDKDYINRGYMTEAVSTLTDYAFAEVGLHRIEANVMPRNARSLRVLEKCGYQPEGLARAYLQINGVWEDHIHMVKLNEAWIRQQR